MPVGSHVFRQLDQEQFVALRTFRQNGEAVDTPVWFAEAEGIIYIETKDTSGKVKRIQKQPQVKLAPCNPLGKLQGPALAGRAYKITDPEEIFKARGALHRKYGLARQAFYFTLRTVALARGQLRHDRVYIAVEPEIIV